MILVRKSWWKILSFLLLVYTIVGGFLMAVPTLPILNETIRNLYFHVCMWFAMMIIFGVSFVYSIKYLRGFNIRNDIFAHQFAAVGSFLGILGYATGTIWANYTWISDQGQSLTTILKEPKLIGTGIALLIYGAYFVLRGSMTDIDKKARISAVYNIFAFAMLFPCIWIIPRLVGSLHPGGEGGANGNPALNFKDVDSRLRMVFYPAVIGWTLLGVWIATLKIRIQLLKDKSLLHE
nr:ABC transporter permease [Ferruginibacter sp. HRS2-29]